MKDEKDTGTIDLFPPPRKAKGRQRKYADGAERQRAYRERAKAEGARVVSRVVRPSPSPSPAAE